MAAAWVRRLSLRSPLVYGSTQSVPESARHYALKMALLAVAVSLALNAAGHAVSAELLAVTVPHVVAAGAVSPASLAAIVHPASVRTLPPIRRRCHAADQPRRQADGATSAANGTVGALPTSATEAISTANSGPPTVAERGANDAREIASERDRTCRDHERTNDRAPSLRGVSDRIQ